jgi:hydrogenase 3 maturation protease
MEEKKMCNPYWSEQLNQMLALAAARKRQNNQLATPLRIAVVGVGNELNGDDAAGNQVAAKLMALSGFPEHFLPINAGSIPENASGVLRRFHPDMVILVDAADFGGEVGEVKWLEAEQIGGMSASSHTLPLPVLGQFLEAELNCKVEYLGIQPESIIFDTPVSLAVGKTIDHVVREFAAAAEKLIY